jgi:hypothetical protein
VGGEGVSGPMCGAPEGKLQHNMSASSPAITPCSCPSQSKVEYKGLHRATGLPEDPAGRDRHQAAAAAAAAGGQAAKNIMSNIVSDLNLV